MEKALLDSRNCNVSLDTIIARYLFSYRITPHSTTGEAPCKLMFNRNLRTRFDALKNSTVDENSERQIKNYPGNRKIHFNLGELVWVRDYRNPS